MPEPSKFLKPYERPKAEDAFTDREKPFAVFDAVRSTIRSDKPTLLTFYGIGGQGKSALCDALIRHLKQEEPRKADFGLLRINDDNRERPHEALLDLRLSIGEHSGIPFHAFDIAFALYWKQPYPEQDLCNYRICRVSRLMDSNLPDLVRIINGFMADHAPSSSLGFIFRVSRWLDQKRQHKWAEHTFPLLRELHEGGKVMSPDQIADRLPLFLAVDLDAYLNKKPDRQVVIFIDEYEQLWKYRQLKGSEDNHPVDESIRELVTDCPGIMFVFFSRERLHWDRVHSGWIEDLKDAQHLLGGLLPADADEFLCKCKMIEPLLRQAIIEMAGGEGAEGCHPGLLDLAVDHYFSLKFGSNKTPQPEDFSTDSVSLADRRRKLVDRFLRGVNSTHFLDMLHYLASAGIFDRSMFGDICQLTGYAPAGFYRLVSFSFVQELEGERYRLHPRMREVLIEDLKHKEHRKYRDIQSFYFKYYDERCRPPSPRGIAPDHEFALSAAARHLLALDEPRFPDWLKDVQEVFYNGARFLLLQSLYERALAILKKTLGSDHPEVAMSLNNIASLLYTQGRYEAALPIYERALAIYEKALGPDHPDSIQIQRNLINLQHKLVESKTSQVSQSTGL